MPATTLALVVGGSGAHGSRDPQELRSRTVETEGEDRRSISCRHLRPLYACSGKWATWEE